MKLFIKIILLTATAIHLNACSWIFGEDGLFRDRSHDYRQAKIEEPLSLPENLNSQTIDQSYDIPVISDHTSLDESFEVPLPEPISQDVDRDAVRINVLENERWILLNGSPGQVWPRLRGFFNLNQLPLQRTDATNGILETIWLTPKGEGALKERYRLRIEQGVQRGTCEVYVLQADIRAGQEDWPTQSSNPEREHIMTKEIAQYLADSTVAASVSMLAEQALDTSGKITLEEEANAGQLYIKLQLPFSRAWPSLKNALTKANFETTDLNRSEQRYYVTYSGRAEEKSEKPGFFSRLSRLFFSEKSDHTNGNYQIVMKSINEKSVAISILSDDGNEIEKSEAERLLKILKRYIS